MRIYVQCYGCSWIACWTWINQWACPFLQHHQSTFSHSPDILGLPRAYSVYDQPLWETICNTKCRHCCSRGMYWGYSTDNGKIDFTCSFIERWSQDSLWATSAEDDHNLLFFCRSVEDCLLDISYCSLILQICCKVKAYEEWCRNGFRDSISAFQGYQHKFQTWIPSS